jgi:hypothetical protein
MGLLNSTVLDWVIGIVFVYLLLAILSTTINEWIAGITSVRAKTLEKGIAQLLDEQPRNADGSAPPFLKLFYSHPLISGMLTPGKTDSDAHPSYLPSRTFATAVMDLATQGVQGSITFAQLESGAKNMPDGDVKTALLALLQNANGDLTRAQKNIEEWYDDTMQRVSGWYKRRTQVVTFWIAILLTLGTNADTIRFAQKLWVNPTLRATIVERAKAKTTTETGKEAAARTESVQYKPDDPLHPHFRGIDNDDVKALTPLLGWTEDDLNDLLNHPRQWPKRLLGWALSIVAISLGAPFWFDMLNKLMNIRNAGKKPETSDDKSGTGASSGKNKSQPQQAAAGGASGS